MSSVMPLSRASATDRSAQSEACFHCGLPIPQDTDLPAIKVLGESRQFCCGGCYAVCEAITGSGLEDYYRFRTREASSSPADVVPDFLDRLDIYDRPEVQKGFVRSDNRSCEAALLLEEIRCPACLWLNERHVRRQPGVLEVSTDTATQRMRVRWDPQQTRLSNILKAIADIGYIAHPYDASHSEQLHKLRQRRSIERLIFAGILGMVVMNFSIATYLMGGPGPDGQLPLWISIGRWTSLFVCLTLLAYPGQDFFIGAWRDLKNRQLGMDVPIVIGLTAAYTGSLYGTITGAEDVYLDSIAMFVFFVLMARYFETRGRVQSAAFLDRLAQAIPATAHRLEADGTHREIPVVDIRQDDRVLVYPGEQVPLDGVILSGESSFDESLLTGESEPVHHKEGDQVVAGSVNGDQAVQIAVRCSSEGSTIEQITRLVDHGMEHRPRSATLAEHAARWFVLAVLVIAGSTATYWSYADPGQWLSNTIAVLIVTCPCALALATPVSLAVGVGNYIRNGILPLRLSALDELSRSDRVVFDKTGTLTGGQLNLVEIVPIGNMDEKDCLYYAKSLLQASEHPVARSICSGGADDARPIDADIHIHNEPGFGVRAMMQGQEWRIGRPEYVKSIQGLTLPAMLSEYEQQGNTVSVLANDQGVEALFILQDSPRPGIADMIHQLRRSGFDRFSIISGDTPASVERLGQLAGITDVNSRMTPAQKLEWMQSRQRAGEVVTMVGDGINDAPTLAAADVSISLSSSTDLANASSDFLLQNDDLLGISDAVQISRDIQRNIKQNLLWAVGYNLLAVPLAAMGYIAPWAAAIGMSASSVIVVFNALRLQSDRQTIRD